MSYKVSFMGRKGRHSAEQLALSSVQMEGLNPTRAARADMSKVVAGSMSVEDAIANTRLRYALSARS